MPQRKGTILWSIPITNVDNFVTHTAFLERLTRGLVFVHNKRPMADLLINHVRQQHGAGISYSCNRLSMVDLNEFENDLVLRRPSRASHRSIVIVECDITTDALSSVLGRLAAAPGRRKGIWIRGHVRDFHPSALRLFDVMFLFDMANDDSELLRSTIPLPREQIDMLRASVRPIRDNYTEAVLVFTAGADYRGRRLTQLAGNPALMPLGVEDIVTTQADMPRAREV